MRREVAMRKLILLWILLVVAVFQVGWSKKRDHHHPHHHHHHHHHGRNRGMLREYERRYRTKNEFEQRERDVDGSIDSSRHSTRHGFPLADEKRIVEIDLGDEKSRREKLPLNSESLKQRHPSTNGTRAKESYTQINPTPTIPPTTSRTIITEAPADIMIPCTTSKDCNPGSCCQNRNGKEMVCMELNVPPGKQCWNYCMCSKGLVCFYKQGIDIEDKDKTGVCKIPQEGDLSHGSYMKP